MNQEFYQYLEYKPFASEDEVWAYFKNHLKLTHERKEIFWLLKDIEKDCIIGTARLTNMDHRRLIAEIGYGINPMFQGRGYFKIVLRLICDYGFDVLMLHKLKVATCSENLSSINGLMNFGFQEEGKLTGEFLRWTGERLDVSIFGLTADRWTHLKHCRN